MGSLLKSSLSLGSCPYSHRVTAAQVESVARRALLASNASYILLQSILEDNSTLEARSELEDR